MNSSFDDKTGTCFLLVNIEKSKFLIFPAAIYPFSGCRMPAVLVEPFSLKTLPVRQKEQETIINIYAELFYNGIEKYFKNNNCCFDNSRCIDECFINWISKTI